MKIRRVYDISAGGATPFRSVSELGPRHRPREEGAIKESQTVRRYAPPSIPLRHTVLHPTPPVALLHPTLKIPQRFHGKCLRKWTKRKRRSLRAPVFRTKIHALLSDLETQQRSARYSPFTARSPSYPCVFRIIYIYRPYVIALFSREINYFRNLNFKIIQFEYSYHSFFFYF